MNRIALYHIETLLWIARLGTFSAAAERLNTSQPSVSARIKELEYHLGIRLFRREGRVLLLTAKGRQIVQECEALWAQMQRTFYSGDAFSKASGIVKIGCGEIAAMKCLPDFVAELNKQMPNVIVEVEIDLTTNLRHKLESGLLDFAFLVGPIDSPALMAESIGAVEMQWLKSSRLEVGPLDDGAMPLLPLWCLSRPSHLYQVTHESIRHSKLGPSKVNTCNNVRTLIDVVVSGGGIAILPEALVRDRILRGELVPEPALAAAGPVEFFAVVRRLEQEPVVLEVYNRAARLQIE